MKKSAFLGACSIAAYLVSAGSAAAQQQGSDAASTAQSDNQQESDEGVTRVPPNSSAAEEVRAKRKAVAEDSRQGKKAAEAASDIIRYEDRIAAPKRSSAADDIMVTGSRLRNGDQTTRLIVLDAKDIRDRGVTTVEELMRTIPQNVSTIGAITNNRGRGPLSSADGPGGKKMISDVGALGLSAANLGGVGAGNTLVLVNGRRIAGAAGIEQGYVNLNGIPLSAIERVEISTGGQAAIYGADAMGGVINFILKKNYVGTTLSASRKETSSGASDTRLSVYTGRGWGSGNVSASVEFGATEPIVNAKTGYVTNNYAPFFGDRSEYDKRSFSSGTQPGTAIQPAVYDPITWELIRPQTGLTVPEGFTGAPTRNDLIEVPLSYARDYVPEYAGPKTRSISGTLSFEQKITDHLSIFGTGIYSRSKNSQVNPIFGGIGVELGAGQYYNPFPAFGLSQYSYSSRVNYFPGSELADGSLVAGRVKNTTENWSANAGLSYDFGKRARIEVIYTKSQSKTTGSGSVVGNLISFNSDPNSPTGYSCYNFLLANNRIPAATLPGFQAAFDKQCEALTSTDPDIAFNPWKGTTDGGGASINTFLYPEVVDVLGTKLDNVEGRVTGELLDLPAGGVTYALGAEYSRNMLKNSALSNVAGPNPTTKRHAFFGEINIPVMGKDFTLPLVRRLLFNIAARRDVSSSIGAIGTVDNVPVDQGGEIIYGKNEFARTTPSFGILWSPTNTIDIRAKFTRGFKAPPPSQIYSVQGTQIYQSQITDDPYYTCTTDCLPYSNGRSYAVPITMAPNLDLRPETSHQQIYSISWLPGGALSGLNVAITYNRNVIDNQFATTRDLGYYMPTAEILKLSQFYPRDASGKIIAYNNMRFNIIGSKYESLTYEASYIFNTSFGSWQPKITYLDNMTAETHGLTDDQVVDQRGRILGVDRYKVVGSLQWNWGKVSTNVFVYHTPSYLNDYMSYYAAGKPTNPELITRVSPLTTVDMSVSWVVTKALNIQLAGRNILKADAPFTVVDNLPYDTARYNVQGRAVTLSARLSF